MGSFLMNEFLIVTLLEAVTLQTMFKKERSFLY
jgi:hypothetical protein